jgi:hypothetical protein
MTLFFDLLVLGGIVVVLLVLGAAAINGGAESRPDFREDDHRFPDHHNIRSSI